MFNEKPDVNSHDHIQIQTEVALCRDGLFATNWNIRARNESRRRRKSCALSIVLNHSHLFFFWFSLIFTSKIKCINWIFFAFYWLIYNEKKMQCIQLKSSSLQWCDYYTYIHQRQCFKISNYVLSCGHYTFDADWNT